MKIGCRAWPTRDHGEKSQKLLYFPVCNSRLNFGVQGQFEFKIFTKKCRQQQNFDLEPKEAWHYNHVTFIETAKNFMLYCRLIHMLSKIFIVRHINTTYFIFFQGHNWLTDYPNSKFHDHCKNATLSSISLNMSKHWRFLAFWLSLCFGSFLLFLVYHDTTFFFSTRAMTALGWLPNVPNEGKKTTNF